MTGTAARLRAQVQRVGKWHLIGIAVLMILVAIGTFANFGAENRAYAATRSESHVTAPLLAPAVGVHLAPATQSNVNYTTDSPATVAARIRSPKGNYASPLDAANLLSFARWHDATNTNAAGLSLTNASASLNTLMSWIAQLCFTFCAFLLYLLGLVLVLWSAIAVLSQVIFTVDHLFGDFGSHVLGMKSGDSTQSNVLFGSISLLGVVILVLIAMGLFQVARSRAMSGVTIGHPGFRSIGVGMLIIIGFSVVASQATKNHPDLSSGTLSAVGTASESTGGTAGSVANSPKTNVTSSFRNWAAFSPGWFVAVAQNGTSLLTGAAAQYTLQMVNAGSHLLNPAADSQECSRYMAAMDDAFTHTKAYSGTGAASNNAQVLLQYSHLYEQTYMRLYTYGALGGSNSAQEAAWCRIAEAETGQDTGEQALLSRMAGLYSPALGVGNSGLIDGGDGMAEAGQGHAPVSVGARAGTLVTADGEWSNEAAGIATVGSNASLFSKNGVVAAAATLKALGEHQPYAYLDAQQLLGPSYLSTSTAMMYYFAACRFPSPGGAAKLDASWASVLKARNSSNSGSPLTTADCGSPNDIGGFSTNQSQAFNYFEKQQSVGNAIQRSITGSIPLIGGLLQSDNNAHSDLPQFANAAGSDQPREYYLLTTGSDTGPVIIMALVCILVAWVLMKLLAPLIVGALLVQFLAVAMLIVLTFIVLLAVLPLRKPRELCGSVLKTVLASMIVGALLTFTFGLIFALCNIFLALIAGSYRGGNGLIEALLIAASYLGGMVIARSVLGRLFGSDVLSARGGLSLPISMASAPLTGTGSNPLEAGFWQGTGLLSDSKRVRSGLDRAKGIFGRSDDFADDKSRRKAEAALIGAGAGATATGLLNKKDGKGVVGDGLMPAGAVGKKAALNGAGRSDDPWSKTGVANKKAPDMTEGLDRKSKVENLINNLVPEARPDLSKLRRPGDISSAPGVSGAVGSPRLLLPSTNPELRGTSPRIPGTDGLDPLSRVASIASVLDSSSGLLLPESAVAAIRDASGAGAALGTEAGLERLSQWTPVGMAGGIEPTAQIPGVSQALIPVAVGDGLGAPLFDTPAPVAAPALSGYIPEMTGGGDTTPTIILPEEAARGHEVQVRNFERAVRDTVARHAEANAAFGERREDVLSAGWQALQDTLGRASEGAAEPLSRSWPGEGRDDVAALAAAVENHLPASRPMRGSSSTVRGMLEQLMSQAETIQARTNKSVSRSTGDES